MLKLCKGQRPESYDSFFSFMERQRFDYMVFETASPAWEHDYRLINQIKARWPDMKIILCGPIASMAQGYGPRRL